MKQKKKGYFWIGIFVLCFLAFCPSIKAEQVALTKGQSHENSEEEEKTQQQVLDAGMSLLDWDSIYKLQDELKSAMPSGITFDVKEEMVKLMRGESKLGMTQILGYVMAMLFGEVELFIQFGGRFILIVLLCNLLETLSSSFQSKNTTKIGFFVCYMVVLLSVVQSFNVMVELARTVIDQMLKVMMICIPILLAFMTTTGYGLSSGTMAPIIISALSMMTTFIEYVVLPCIISVVVLEVVSSMSETFKVDKLISLFYKGLKYVLRTILIASVGLLSMYRMVMPYVDMTVKKATIKFSSAFIPIVGNAVGGAIDFITAGAGLIKNTFSISIIIWLLLIMCIPLIKIFAYIVVYNVRAAVIEPLGDKKMAKIASKLGKGSQFIMSTVGIVAILCICTLIICMTIGTPGA